MAGLGRIVGGATLAGIAGGATATAVTNGDDAPSWNVTKGAAAATVGLVAVTVAAAMGRNVRALEHALPLAEIGSIAMLGSFGAAGVATGSAGVNLLEQLT